MSDHTRNLALSLTLALVAGSAAIAEPAPRPKINPVIRHVEDWSVLADAPADMKTDLFDPIKYIPLVDDGSIWASFGGQVRYRFESFNNFGFGASNDDEYSLLRVRMHGDLHIGEHVRVFAEGKSALANNRDLPGGRRGLDVDSIDLQNLFVDLELPIGDGRVGDGARRPTGVGVRQATTDQPAGLVEYAAHVGRRFGDHEDRAVDGHAVLDAVRARAEVQLQRPRCADASCSACTRPARCRARGCRPRMSTSSGSTATTPGRSTARPGRKCAIRSVQGCSGKVGQTGFDYDAEFAYQFGEVGSGDVDAWMVGSQFGYTFADVPTAPRLFIGLDYASGDDSPGGDVETFNQLFPLGHAYLGFIDAIGRQNIIDVTPGIVIKPMPKLTVLLQGHLFWRADENDAVYNAGGGVLRAGSLSNDREVGAEIDLVVTYAFDAHLIAQFGYSHFFAGDFISEATPAADDDIDFFYFQLQYTF